MIGRIVIYAVVALVCFSVGWLARGWKIRKGIKVKSKTDDATVEFPLPVPETDPAALEKVHELALEERLSEKMQAELYERIKELFEKEKPFLNPNYTLLDLSEGVFSNRHYVSTAIKNCSKLNFKQFLNYYRILYAVETFQNDPSLRVSELAEKSGFNTGACFAMAFKSVMNMTPVDWCKSVRISCALPEASNKTHPDHHI